jgi:hypothetical protein
MGFTLQSFPLENSIALSSNTITQLNSCCSLPHTLASRNVCEIVKLSQSENQCDLTNTNPKKVLIHSQVRSLQEKVLPFFLEAVTLLGYVGLLGKLTHLPRLKQSSSLVLFPPPQAIAAGTSESWEQTSQSRIRGVGSSLIGFVPFS